MPGPFFGAKMVLLSQHPACMHALGVAEAVGQGAEAGRCAVSYNVAASTRGCYIPFWAVFMLTATSNSPGLVNAQPLICRILRPPGLCLPLNATMLAFSDSYQCWRRAAGAAAGGGGRGGGQGGGAPAARGVAQGGRAGGAGRAGGSPRIWLPQLPCLLPCWLSCLLAGLCVEGSEWSVGLHGGGGPAHQGDWQHALGAKEASCSKACRLDPSKD